jgi:EAL domain-containing protein (putative c-di-GMP-specific phosphodiesterase class I)
LRTALQQSKTWLNAGMAPMVMAVNVSAVQFRQPNFPEMVSQMLKEIEIPARYLELELTEGVAMGDPQSAIAIMDDLHKRGVRMSIDDFGTGYSSLNYLKKFKIYKLKIDQSFVRDICVDSDDSALVTTIIQMAHSMGMLAIAEGVETQAQWDFLRAHQCDEVQGYLFSKPLPAEKLVTFVQDQALGASEASL